MYWHLRTYMIYVHMQTMCLCSLCLLSLCQGCWIIRECWQLPYTPLHIHVDIKYLFQNKNFINKPVWGLHYNFKVMCTGYTNQISVFIKYNHNFHVVYFVIEVLGLLPCFAHKIDTGLYCTVVTPFCFKALQAYCFILALTGTLSQLFHFLLFLPASCNYYSIFHENFNFHL